MQANAPINTPSNPPALHHYAGDNREEIPWNPVLEKSCSFPSQIFLDTMQDMILNPNYNTSWILRADILFDSFSSGNGIAGEFLPEGASGGPRTYVQAHDIEMRGFSPTRKLVRKFVPRNPQRDETANQTCMFFEEKLVHRSLKQRRTLVVFLTHASAVEELPYYLPAVKAVAFLHEESVLTGALSISIHYFFFPPPTGGSPVLTTRLERTALRLMERIIKVGNGNVNGYEKKVHHDLVIPRERSQDTYLKLRLRHAPRLMAGWVEKTDPKKHVFEDILIAAFLIELWDDMYGETNFPGFVDIGCGNGVLVDILLKEGYKGYGFDARRRMTWSTFDEESQGYLHEMVLVPWMLEDEMLRASETEGFAGFGVTSQEGVEFEGGKNSGIHDGRFGEGTFIISNHADELTGWTPLLSKASNSPFLIIPCCSHDLSGHKHRHKSAKFTAERNVGRIDKATRVGTISSEYASLVEWVTKIAEDIGYVVEREVLRIPSTRNIGLIGRICKDGGLGLEEVLEREGGGVGWADKALALRKVQLQKGHC